MSKEKKPLNVKREIFEWAVSIAVALVAVFLIRTLLFTMIRVEGPSMLDTLHDGDRIASTIVDLRLSGPARGDIVVCTYPGEDHYCIKRVIGLPGEVLEVQGGVTYIDGEQLPEPYVTRPLNYDYGPIALGEDEYFVMGDNRQNSLDSRDVGPLAARDLDAIARLRLWPLDRIGLVS